MIDVNMARLRGTLLTVAHIIVGAPFEDAGHGVAYVYHGYEAGLVNHYVQKLTPLSLNLPAGDAASPVSHTAIDSGATTPALHCWPLCTAGWYGTLCATTSAHSRTLWLLQTGPENLATLWLLAYIAHYFRDFCDNCAI